MPTRGMTIPSRNMLCKGVIVLLLQLLLSVMVHCLNISIFCEEDFKGLQYITFLKGKNESLFPQFLDRP